MKIGIATPVLIEGDAVGNDVMGMYVSLKKAGHTPILYAEAAHVPFPVTPINQMAGLDAYIYHHSVYCNLGVKFFKELNCRKIVKYHNITPPHWFAPGTDAFVHCTLGLNQIKDILIEPCEVWVDSEYNGRCLNEVTPCQFKVIPPFNQVDILQETVSDAKTVLPFDDWNTNIIMVGRVAPNKNVLGAIEAFHAYLQHNKNSRLIIVGDDGGSYGEEVKQRIAKLGLSKVVITGKVNISVLKAFYLIADALLITSQHEGFCVPMVEAMAMRIPVIANRQCALPYTGGDAVCYAENASEIVAGIQHVLENRTSFIDKGYRRFKEHYQNLAIESALLFSISMQAK